MFKFEMHKAEKKMTNTDFLKSDLTVYFKDAVYNEDISELETRTANYMDSLAKIIGNKEKQIDFGGAAIIYENDDLVLKVMSNRHTKSDMNKYNLGASPHEEFSFMERLHTLIYEGARSPAPLACIESGETAILIMERLRAVNLQHVLNGTAELPEGFDYEDFYSKLEGYLNNMHDTAHIAHNDLFPRNIMVDEVTGMPYVIDFGRAKNFIAGNLDTATKDDWDKYDTIYTKLEEYRKNEATEIHTITSRHEEFILSHQPRVHYSPSVILQAREIAEKGIPEGEASTLTLGGATSVAITRDASKVLGAMQFELHGVTYYIGKTVTPDILA